MEPAVARSISIHRRHEIPKIVMCQMLNSRASGFVHRDLEKGNPRSVQRSKATEATSSPIRLSLLGNEDFRHAPAVLTVFTFPLQMYVPLFAAAARHRVAAPAGHHRGLAAQQAADALKRPCHLRLVHVGRREPGALGGARLAHPDLTVRV